jgi:outer membrane protein insertion porin family
LADLSIRERNLLGKGQDLLFSTTIAGERTQFNIAFTEPYFMEKNLEAGIDLFHTTRDLQDESSYDQMQTGGGFHFQFPLADKWTQRLGYRLERNKIENVSANASRFIRDQKGERVTSSISQRLTYDDRDNSLFPTEGLYSWFETDVAGLGGDAKYISGRLGSIYYVPVTEKVVFSLLGETGLIEGLDNEVVQINERFFLGGNTLRGFEYTGLGPRDIATDDSLGGNAFYRGSAEVEFPVGLPQELGIKGHAFSDFGSLWDVDESGAGLVDDNSIRASVGFGVSWRSPLGPVRIDFAAPIAEEDYDDTETVRFNFGTRF